MYQNKPTKVRTGEARLTYVNLTAPRAPKQGGDPKYSVTMLIPKTDLATKANIDSSAEAAAQVAMGKLWSGVRPPMLPIPIHDGDGVRENGTPFGAECAGHWVITASSKTKPGVVHYPDYEIEVAPQDIYSGMYGHVTLNFYGYMVNGKKGIGCGLGNVAKTRDGEPLGGGASAAVDFADVGIAPVYQQPAQPQYQPPAQPQYQQPAQPQYQQPAQPQFAQVNPLTGLPY